MERTLSDSSSKPINQEPDDVDPVAAIVHAGSLQLKTSCPPSISNVPATSCPHPATPYPPESSVISVLLGTPSLAPKELKDTMDTPSPAPKESQQPQLKPPDEESEVPPAKTNLVNVGRPWTTGLFDCGLHETNAVMTALLPCVTFGQIAEILDEGESSCTLSSFMYMLMAPALCTCWILGFNYRLKLRNKYNLVEAPADDWIVHLLCPCCSLCQEFRELHNRGIDPSLGWMGHLAQQHAQETSGVPPKNQSMSK